MRKVSEEPLIAGVPRHLAGIFPSQALSSKLLRLWAVLRAAQSLLLKGKEESESCIERVTIVGWGKIAIERTRSVEEEPNK